IPSISSDSRANDESVLAVPVDKIFRQSTDCRASSIRRDFIESVEQDAAASRFENRFDVSSADLKVIRSESISDELYQGAGTGMSFLFQEIRQIPTRYKDRDW